MLKKITKEEIITMKAMGIPVYWLEPIEENITLGEIMTLEEFVADIPEDPEEEAEAKPSEKPKRGGSKKRELPAETEKKILQQFGEGLSYNQIAQRTGIGIGIVKRIVKEHDPEGAKKHAGGRGRQAGGSYPPIPKDVVDRGKIGALSKAGWPVEKIADEMNITTDDINEVLYGGS